MATILQYLVYGLQLGSVYALLALGYTMVYGIVGMINTAHGDFLMIGALGTYFIAKLFDNMSIDGTYPMLAVGCIILIAMVMTGGIASGVEAIAYRPLFIGGALAAVSGICYASAYPQVEVYMGSWLGNMSFVAAVLGGIGDIRGAMLGGFILGIAQIFATAINSTFGYAVGFIILIVILLVKPAGIMGKLTTEKV